MLLLLMLLLYDSPQTGLIDVWKRKTLAELKSSLGTASEEILAAEADSKIQVRLTELLASAIEY